MKGESFDPSRSSGGEPGGSFARSTPDGAAPPITKVISPHTNPRQDLPRESGSLQRIPPGETIPRRKEQVVALVAKHPGLTETEIAEQLGLKDVGLLKTIMPGLKRDGRIGIQRTYDNVTRTFTTRHHVITPSDEKQQK